MVVLKKGIIRGDLYTSLILIGLVIPNLLMKPVIANFISSLSYLISYSIY